MTLPSLPSDEQLARARETAIGSDWFFSDVGFGPRFLYHGEALLRRTRLRVPVAEADGWCSVRDWNVAGGHLTVTFHCIDGDVSYGLSDHDPVTDTWLATRSSEVSNSWLTPGWRPDPRVRPWSMGVVPDPNPPPGRALIQRLLIPGWAQMFLEQMGPEASDITIRRWLPCFCGAPILRPVREVPVFQHGDDEIFSALPGPWQADGWTYEDLTHSGGNGWVPLNIETLHARETSGWRSLTPIGATSPSQSHQAASQAHSSRNLPISSPVTSCSLVLTIGDLSVNIH